jgi:hypothetical protein
MRGHDAELFLFRDDANFGNANPIIDAKARFRAAAIETSSRRPDVHRDSSLFMCSGNLLRFCAGGGFTLHRSGPRGYFGEIRPISPVRLDPYGRLKMETAGAKPTVFP